MDGSTLTDAMHQRGINMRYLGKVVDFITKTPARTQLDHIYVSEPCGFWWVTVSGWCRGWTWKIQA